MRILCLTSPLREHGTYFRALHLARALVTRGHAVTLLTAAPHHWYRTARETLRGVEVIETPSWNPLVHADDGWGPLDALWRLGHVARHRYDLIYAFAHPPTVYLPARLAHLLRGTPVVADWCDAYRDGIFLLRQRDRQANPRAACGPCPAAQRWAERVEVRLERGILRRAQGVTVISRLLEQEALAAGVPRERVLRVPSGAELEVFRPLSKEDCRRALGLPENSGPWVGYVANYNPDEAFFVEALRIAFAQCPGARLLTACPRFSQDLLKQAGLADRVTELERVDFERIPQVLGAADVLALPLAESAANRARWPNKFGDYLAAGRPTVTCAIGDLGDYFPSPPSLEAWLAGETEAPDRLPIGWAAPCDSAAFGHALGQLLDHPDRWDAMGHAARQLAETDLNWENLIVEVERFLERTMKNG
ncbi:MAG TPA: glycosyltransferase family 4 protein [Candidatus Sumerlaeota bacterium]|nr:glycosyltransferase family 4 protein [Candidatus Sumerlaeota bacterium]